MCINNVNILVYDGEWMIRSTC